MKTKCELQKGDVVEMLRKTLQISEKWVGSWDKSLKFQGEYFEED